jgi:hypothetical protein
MKELHKSLGFDERVIRHTVIKIGDTLKGISDWNVRNEQLNVINKNI